MILNCDLTWRYPLVDASCFTVIWLIIELDGWSGRKFNEPATWVWSYKMADRLLCILDSQSYRSQTGEQCPSWKDTPYRSDGVEHHAYSFSFIAAHPHFYTVIALSSTGLHSICHVIVVVMLFNVKLITFWISYCYCNNWKLHRFLFLLIIFLSYESIFNVNQFVIKHEFIQYAEWLNFHNKNYNFFTEIVRYVMWFREILPPWLLLLLLLLVCIVVTLS